MLHVNETAGWSAESMANQNADNYGKVKKVEKGINGANGLTAFLYDAGGNRVMKRQVTANNIATTSYYVRDASGNIMGVYEKKEESGTLVSHDLIELPIYGSDRLGTYSRTIDITGMGSAGTPLEPGEVRITANTVKNAYEGVSYLLDAGVELTLDAGFTYQSTTTNSFSVRVGTGGSGLPELEDGIYGRFLNSRRYELKDHLGNVRTVVTDVKLSTITGSTPASFQPEVVSLYNYYPFGMEQPGRTWTNGGKYRYGFNGKEKDENGEWGGATNYDYGFRIYNPSIGRFLSVDPLTRSYPWYTPYQFAGNKPVNSIDLDGLEEYSSYQAYKIHNGAAALSESALDGCNGVWFSNDRVSRNSRWSNAMEYITKNEEASKFQSIRYSGNTLSLDTYPFKQVRDYYLWVQNEMDQKGYGSRWAKGAAYLVDELADTFQSTDNANVSVSSGGFMPNLGGLLKELNLGIATYALGKFNSVLYGSEGRTIQDWYSWDRNLVFEEQVTIAAPGIYMKFNGSSELNSMNALASKSGIFSLAVSKHFFPDFSLFGVDLTDESSGWGVSGRFNIPLYMLYPDRHQREAGQLNSQQSAEIKKANRGINSYYNANRIKR